MKTTLLKKTLALALLTVSSLASCGKQSSGDADITMWVVQIDSNAAGLNFSDSPVFKKLEEISGKKIKMIMGTNYQQLLATKSYPEVIVWGSYPGGYDLGLQSGVIRDLTDLVDQYAPNYKAVLNSNKDIFNTVTTSTGRIPAMFEIFDQVEGPWYGYYMRKDILDKYNLSVPVTYEDWENIFDTVKKGGDFKSPCYLSPQGADILDFLNCGYGVGAGGFNDFTLTHEGNTLTYGPVDARFKDYLTRMNSWYNEGYISKGFSLGTAQIVPETADIVGTPSSPATYMAFPYTMSQDTLEEAAHQTGNADYELVPVDYPRLKGHENEKLHIRVAPGYGGTSMVITDKCTDDQKAIDIVKWFDYLYSPEGSLLANYGIEGDGYTLVDGQPRLTEKVTSDIQGRYRYATSNFPCLRRRDIDNSTLTEKARNAEKVWSQNNDAAYSLTYGLSLPADEADEANKKVTAIKQYKSESLVKFVNGTKALSSFDDFVAQMNSLGLPEVMKQYQAVQDAYTSKSYPWSN